MSAGNAALHIPSAGTNEASIAHRLRSQPTLADAEADAPVKAPEFRYPSEAGDNDQATISAPDLEQQLSHAQQQELDYASLQEHHQRGADLARTVTTLTSTTEKFKVVSWNVRTPEDSVATVSADPYDDPGFPPSWSKARRWFIVLVIVTCCTCGTSASSLTTTGTKNLENQLHISREVTILGVTCFLTGLGIGPIFFGPLSEFYGRKNIYIISLTAYILLNFPVAFANNPAVFFIFRFLDAFVVSSFGMLPSQYLSGVER